jgi:transposase
MVEGGQVAVASLATPESAETPVLKEAVVEEVLARLARGERVVAVARSYDIDPKTVRAWRARGRYVPRVRTPRPTQLDAYAAWLRARAPEVDFNAVVLQRELAAQGYAGSAMQVSRFVRPLRVAARVGAAATVRFETPPGQQAQVDFGQRKLWIGDGYVAAHVFVFTLGYSRRTYAWATPHERLTALLEGHERAFQHFGGVPAQIVVDNARVAVLHHGRDAVVFHPVYADFAGYYGFRAWAHAPYRPQTKGKVESGVKYVKRNALTGKRFGSWDHLNGWLVEWATTIADRRVHGTTHEVPLARFAAEQLTPVTGRPAYRHERVRHRVVPKDALVAIDGSRYSVPVRFVGATVTIRELASGYEIWAGEEPIAQHPRLGRHRVAMEPAHYAGLLRPGGRSALPPLPPRWDPGYPAGADVEVRDLATYAALVEAGV